MRSLARWSILISFCVAVVVAAVQPAWGRGPHRIASDIASTDAPATASGFKSQPAPEKPAYIGPGVAISGSTLINALVPPPSLAAWRLPSRTAAAWSSALHASRVSPHLRSIPLLI